MLQVPLSFPVTLLDQRYQLIVPRIRDSLFDIRYSFCSASER